MPRQSFAGQYLHVDLFEMAAAYAFYLAESQSFVDVNKRTGLASALTASADAVAKAMLSTTRRRAPPPRSCDDNGPALEANAVVGWSRPTREVSEEVDDDLGRKGTRDLSFADWMKWLAPTTTG